MEQRPRADDQVSGGAQEPITASVWRPIQRRITRHRVLSLQAPGALLPLRQGDVVTYHCERLGALLSPCQGYVMSYHRESLADAGAE